ncbi:MAG: ankyrin repeat domain-containing protein, partial [Candidatus Margulisbacteria bacterium]|nr:ankyrin repeat domain-containing protein [Candidatus Margulisiibacteriota bacterium]
MFNKIISDEESVVNIVSRMLHGILVSGELEMVRELSMYLQTQVPGPDVRYVFKKINGFRFLQAPSCPRIKGKDEPHKIFSRVLNRIYFYLSDIKKCTGTKALFEFGENLIYFLQVNSKKINSAGRKKSFTDEFIKAVINNNLDLVKKLINEGEDINIQTKTNKRTLLQLAVYRGHLEIAKLLIQAGADQKAQNKDGFTALMLAVSSYNISYNDKLKFIKFLLNSGSASTVNVHNKKQLTALELAVYDGHLEIVCLLLGGVDKQEIITAVPELKDKKKLKAFFKNPSDRILVFDDDSSVFINTIIKDVGQRDILSKM